MKFNQVLGYFVCVSLWLLPGAGQAGIADWFGYHTTTPSTAEPAQPVPDAATSDDAMEERPAALLPPVLPSDWKSPNAPAVAPPEPIVATMPPAVPVPSPNPALPAFPTDPSPAPAAVVATPAPATLPPAPPVPAAPTAPAWSEVKPMPVEKALSKPAQAQATVSAAPASIPVMRESGVDGAWRDGGFVRSLQGDETIVTLPIDSSSKPDSYEPLRLDEAVALTLYNNDAIKAVGENSEAAYWEKLASYALYGPTVEVRYATGQEQSKPASYNDATGVRVMDDKHPRHDTLLSIRQPIIDAAVLSDIMTKKTREDFANDTARDTRESLALDTITVYLRLIQSSMSMKLAADYGEYLRRLETRMQARVEGGGATAGDLERIRGRKTNAESARIEAEGQFQNDLAEFKRLTHVTPARLAIPDTLAPALPASMQDAIEHAVVANPGYRAAVRKIDLARKTRDHSYSVLAPTMNVEYEHNKSYDAGGSARGNPVDGVYPNQDDTRLMLVAHWSLSGGYDIMNGVAGERRVSQASFEAADARMQLEQAVRASYTAVNAANARMDVVRQGVVSNTKVVNEFEDQQDNGHRSLFDLLDAYEQLYNSRLSLVRLVVARASSSYLVHREMGSLLRAMLEASQNTGPIPGKGE